MNRIVIDAEFIEEPPADVDPTDPAGRSFAGMRFNRWEAFAGDYAGWLQHLAPNRGPETERMGSKLLSASLGCRSLADLRRIFREICGVELEACVPAVREAQAARGR